jgi:vancomycin resistance protein VanW
MKKYIPYSIKRLIKQSLRIGKDLRTKDQGLFGKIRKEKILFTHTSTLHQHIFPSNLYENKIHNLTLAGNKINRYTLAPGEIFSFWNIIGNPTSTKGYKKGRNLVNGKLTEEDGGGLCQLSGIIYHISLINGLEIMERYSHSMDIYTEENRFTPLGADATIVYGYKDLRIKNTTNFFLQFEFKVEQDQLTCYLHSTEKIESREIIFDRVNLNEVITCYNQNGLKINLTRSVYKK